MAYKVLKAIRTLNACDLGYVARSDSVHGVEIKPEGVLTVSRDTGVRFRKAVDAISLWIRHAPYPQTDREWRKLYLELDAEVKKALPQLRQSSEINGSGRN